MSAADKTGEALRLLREAEAELATALRGDKTRRRGDLLRQLHEVRRHLATSYAYVSQAGQDFVVDRLLNGRRDGVFVDVGGYDGVTGSNTLFFEMWRNWSGLLVEPAGRQLEKARAVRRCPCVGCAVSNAEGEAEFIEVEEGYTQMSGLAGSYDAAMLERVRADARHRETVSRVPTRTLPSLLGEHGIAAADFVSLDIEGGELAVLESFPFADIPVTVWAIENNTAAPGIRTIMESNGYDLVEFAGVDEIYRKRD